MSRFNALFFVLAAMLLSSACFPAWAAIQGEYFSWTGASPPADPFAPSSHRGTRIDANVNFNWGGDPGIGGLGADFFAVRWRGQVFVPTAGDWTFTTNTDDGARLYLNGELVINQWVDQGPTPVSATRTLAVGWHDIHMQYYENGGGAVADLVWAGPGVGQQVIPAGSLRAEFGKGLLADYYEGNWGGQTLRVSRNDPTINFDWGTGSPQPEVPAENFSARWRGKVEAPSTGNYTFYLTSDDGPAMWLIGVERFNQLPIGHAPTEYGFSVALTAGQKYFIEVRFNEFGGGASCRLEWDGPGTGGRQVVPEQRLQAILNEAPTSIALSNAAIGSNLPANSVVGALSTTDIDNSTGANPLQTHTYALVSGTGDTNNALFNISGSNLRATNANMAVGTYSIRVRTTDNGQIPNNLTYERTFTITVNDTTPPVAVCQNISRTLPGPIVVNAIDIDGGSTDNVGITARTINGGASQTYTSANVGANSATLLVRDAAGNTNSCSATVTILKGSSTIVATGATSYTYSGGPQGPGDATVTGSTGVVSHSYSGTGATSYGPSSTKPANAGTYQVVATVAADANYNGATSAPLAFTILKATPTAALAVSNSPVTYDGSAKSATVDVTSSSTPGAAANVLTGGAADQTNANTYAVTADFVPTDTANYNTVPGLAAGDFVINKATPTATLIVTNSPVTYDGGAKSATVGVASSSTPGAAANVLTGGAADQTNANTYAVTADFVPADSANYNPLTGLAAGDFVINKATPTATLAVTNSPATYDGSAKSATVDVASSSTPGAVANVLTGGAADQTNANTYAVTADFVPADSANYNPLTGLAAGDFVIDRATPTATLTVTNSPVTYDGGAKSATVDVAFSSTPGAAANVLTGGAVGQTNAGTYAVTADFVPADTVNYNTLTGLSAGDFVIDRATPTATLAVTNSPVAYNGAARAATVGVASSSTPGAAASIETGGAASQTNVGTYAVTADFVPTDTVNYNPLTGLSAGDFVIDTAAVTVTLVDVVKLWDGNTAVTLFPANFSVQGLAPGESLAISQTEGAFSSSDIGSDIPVSAVLTGFIAAGPGTDLDNYTLPAAANGLGTITDKLIPVVTWPAASAIVFGQALGASTLSGGSATDPITSNPVSGTFDFDDDTVVPPAAGSYAAAVTFTPADLATYAPRQTQIPVVVQKATPVIVTPPTASLLREGQSLADSALTGGAASVDGGFDWTDGAIVPLLGVSDQSVTFTPGDAANYEAVLLGVSVTVIPAVDLEVVAAGDTYFARPLQGLVTFSVQVQGSLGALSYQWYKLTDDKARITVGPDASVFTIDPIGEEDFGEYLCEVYDFMRDETAESPVFTLVLTSGLPAVGLLGLALASALTALAGAAAARKRR